MRPLLVAITLTTLASAPASAFAQTEFEVGQFIKQTQRWDEDTNSFQKGADKGEGEGCWRVTGVNRAMAEPG